MNRRWQTRKPGVRAAALLTGALFLAACGGTSDTSIAEEPMTIGPSQAEIDAALATPTTLLVWGWDPAAATLAEAFMKKYPAITIDYQNVGVGQTGYDKIRAALLAGTGIPDVVYIEGSEIPSFVLKEAFVDMNTMGAASMEGEFSPSTWATGVIGDGLYGLPDFGNNVANFYRKDLFDKAGITTPPLTWEQLYADGLVMKEKLGITIANFSPTDNGPMYFQMLQAGAKPFSWTPGTQNVTVDLNSAETKGMMKYWTDGIAAGIFGTTGTWVDNTGWEAFDKGKIATWQVGSWGGAVLDGATKTAGKWRAAPFPQYTEGAGIGANWQGGIAYAITKASPNPIAAYEFAKFVAADPEYSVTKWKDFAFLPVLKIDTTDSAWLATTDAFLGGQQSNKEVWAQALADTAPEVSWLPFHSFLYGAWVETVATAAKEGTDMNAALDAWQAKVVEYAEQQGFTVN